MEKLEYAIRYGADAVYMGGPDFGLRNMAGNFDLPDMPEALRLCHANNVRSYLTINSYPQDSMLGQLEEYLNDLAALPFDAYIVSDPGVMRMVRRISPWREIHLSTQANTINHESALFWQEQGVTQINLAREMTLDDISRTASCLKIPCEVFVHGALCIAYSGRCLLSSALTGRSANMGECTQPCRWKYALVEETRPGQYLPVLEEKNATFVFNSRDLCLLEYIPELVRAGVGSLKIEGRMKGIHYLAGVLRLYRAALDSFCKDPDNYSPDPGWMQELTTLSHRGYTTGFLFGDPQDVGQSYQAGYQRSHLLVGSVEVCPESGRQIVLVRNRFRTGDQLELIGPAMKRSSFTAEKLCLADCGDSSATIEYANPNMRLLMKLPDNTAVGDLLRLPPTAE